MNKNLLFVAIAFIGFQSCKIFNPEDLVPSYIYVTDLVVNPNNNQGTSSDNLTDAWVYINGNLIGTYELPSKIPVHVEGSYNLQIFAGMKSNGLTNIRIQNDFLNPFDTTMNSAPSRTDTITPVITYESSARFWIEDFEDPGVKFSTMPNSDTSLLITNNTSLVLEGNGSGIIQLGAGQSRFECRTSETTFDNFPKQGAPIYIEVDYNSNEILTFGIYHNNNSSVLIKQEHINLFPTDGKWKKIYLSLTDLVSSQLNASEFELYIEVVKNRSSAPLVLIDNLKVIY